jgi:hypothetical protein
MSAKGPLTQGDVTAFLKKLPETFSGVELGGAHLKPEWQGWIITTGSKWTDKETGENLPSPPMLMNRVFVRRGDKYWQAPTFIPLDWVELCRDRGIDPAELGREKMESAWLALRDLLRREPA